MAYTINYLWPAPVNNSSTPPTSVQAAAVNSVVATIYPGNSADNAIYITHNFGVSNSDITNGFPLVSVEPIDSLGSGSNYYISTQNANYVGLSRGGTTAGVDSQAQAKVVIQTPHTIIR